MCDIGYLIRDHIPAVIQALSIELRGNGLNIAIQPTRCFYTAVMMMYLLLGSDAIKQLPYCNNDEIQKRFSTTQTSSIDVSSSLNDHIFSNDGHTIFYILLTNYKTPDDDKGVKYFFPGHVFVVERTPIFKFNLYQSYIDKYDMNQYISDAKSLSIGKTKMKRLMNSLSLMMQTPKWDNSTSEFWSELTNTSIEESNSFIGMDIGNILLCYSKSDVKDCNASLLSLLDKHIDILEKTPDKSQIYGSHTDIKNNEIPPLTVAQMLNHFTEIKKKMY
jgi:hypothetical protein